MLTYAVAYPVAYADVCWHAHGTDARQVLGDKQAAARLYLQLLARTYADVG